MADCVRKKSSSYVSSYHISSQLQQQSTSHLTLTPFFLSFNEQRTFTSTKAIKTPETKGRLVRNSKFQSQKTYPRCKPSHRLGHTLPHSQNQVYRSTQSCKTNQTCRPKVGSVDQLNLVGPTRPVGSKLCLQTHSIIQNQLCLYAQNQVYRPTQSCKTNQACRPKIRSVDQLNPIRPTRLVDPKSNLQTY